MLIIATDLNQENSIEKADKTNTHKVTNTRTMESLSQKKTPSNPIEKENKHKRSLITGTNQDKNNISTKEKKV